MCKASAISDATGLGYNNVSGVETGVCVDGAETIDDNRPKSAEGKVDIVAKEKQTNTNSKIYYVMHSSKNRTPMMLDKINNTLLLISSQLNV